MLYLDQPKTGSHAVISPEMALMEGRIRTDGVDDLRSFERAFPLDPQVVLEVSKEVMQRHNVDGTMDPGRARTLLSPKEKSDIYFKEILPKVYRPSAVPGWTANLYFLIEGAGDYTVAASPTGVSVAEGEVGEPTSKTVISMPSFQALLRWEALEGASQLDDVRVVSDEDQSDELTDDQLELVAGGKKKKKNSCSAEATQAAACASDQCAAAAGGGTACGGALCDADAGGGAACGGAVCGLAACGGDACGADACGGDACAGNVCAVALGPVGGCAAQACAADFAPGPDFGPCALNIVPAVPFI